MSIGAVIFLLCFATCMDYYKRKRLIESLNALDRESFDHYTITTSDRQTQDAELDENRALGAAKT